jgi:hypothetical protein
MTTHTPDADFIAQSLACAVLDGEQDTFNELAQRAIVWLGTQAAAEVLNTQVPVLLPSEAVPTLLLWLTGPEGYAAAVQDFLAALMKGLLWAGKPCSYDGQRLLLTPASWAWVEETYVPSAVAQTRPFVTVMG